MNPYDANRHPGKHLLATTVGVAHRPDQPLSWAATRVIGAANELDELHNRVTHAAQDAHRLLEPVAHGELVGAGASYELLQTALSKLGDLLSWQDRAYDRLVESTSAYHRRLPDPDAAVRSATKAYGLGHGPSSGRDDDWAIAGDRQLRALEAVEAGGLCLRRTAIGEDLYLSDGTGLHSQPQVETVRRLIDDGLIHRDSSENPYRPGQLLSLTPHGEAALHEARTATPQVPAAPDRSNIPTAPVVLADSVVQPGTTATVKSSGSR